MDQIVPLTLADAAKRIGALELRASRRRDYLSAINAAAELLHRNPSELPADIADLRERLTPIHHVQAGMSPKRLANIKSDLAAALRRVLQCCVAPRSKVERSEEWAQFIGSLEPPWRALRNPLIS